MKLIKELLEKEPELLKEQGISMRRDVTTFIQKCDTCIKLSDRKFCHMTKKVYDINIWSLRKHCN